MLGPLLILIVLMGTMFFWRQVLALALGLLAVASLIGLYQIAHILHL